MKTRKLTWLVLAGAATLMLSNCAGDLSPMSADREGHVDEEAMRLGLGKTKVAKPTIEPVVVPLVAGRQRQVGEVSIWNDGRRLYVKAVAQPKWLLLETQLEITTSVDDIPQTRRGVPIPGQFTFAREYEKAVAEDTYEMEQEWTGGTELAVALHASFVRAQAAKHGSEVAVTRRFGRWGARRSARVKARRRVRRYVRRRVATAFMRHAGAWAGEEYFSGRPWARYFTYTVQKVAVPPKPKPKPPKKDPPAKKPPAKK
jgi:hypothetical protein